MSNDNLKHGVRVHITFSAEPERDTLDVLPFATFAVIYPRYAAIVGTEAGNYALRFNDFDRLRVIRIYGRNAYVTEET